MQHFLLLKDKENNLVKVAIKISYRPLQFLKNNNHKKHKAVAGIFLHPDIPTFNDC